MNDCRIPFLTFNDFFLVKIPFIIIFIGIYVARLCFWNDNDRIASGKK